MRNFFITGTDTDAFRARGVRVEPMKPIAAGTTSVNGSEVNSDVVALREVSASGAALTDTNPYCFTLPIAPHLAAKAAGVVVEMATIHTAFARLQIAADTVIVEGAGGFLVPLSDGQSMAEIPRLLALDVILVVGMRLGVINHALLTVEAITSRGLTLAGWIANSPLEAAQMLAFEDNIATLTALIPAPLLGILPFAGEAGSASEHARRAAQHLQIQPLL
jgi:dethiobiotin synthetase